MSHSPRCSEINARPPVCVCVCGSHLLSLARFHLCASQGRLDCLEVIIAHGADLTVPESAGRRPEAVGPLALADYSQSRVHCLLTDSRPQRPSPRSQKQPTRVFKKTSAGKVAQ